MRSPLCRRGGRAVPDPDAGAAHAAPRRDRRRQPRPRPEGGARGSAGAALGLLAVLLFSLTLPATRLALERLPSGLVGPGRSVGAALAAAVVALTVRGWAAGRGSHRGRHLARETTSWLPPAAAWPSVLVVAAGTTTAFPWLSTLAVTRLPAAHGAVLLGLLPLLTSGLATLRAGERPSARFWLAALAGSGVVVGFAIRQGAGRPHAGDFLMLAAIVLAAAGHAEGGRLARRYGGFLPIAWGLWAALPLTLAATWSSLTAGAGASSIQGTTPSGPPAVASPPLPPATPTPVAKPGLDPAARAWLAWLYISVVTQFGAFILWYRAMALAGVARTSQLQLLQPFLTLYAAHAALGERVDGVTVLATAAVALVVAVGRRAPVHPAKTPPSAPRTEKRPPAGPPPWPPLRPPPGEVPPPRRG
ncbi:MAG TPA: DMT family transporter [Thermaerobacter sp.]